MGVKLTSLVTALNVKMGEVTETLDLPVEGSLDKVDGGKDTIRDDSGIVSGLYAVDQSFCQFRRDSRIKKNRGKLTDTPGDLLSLRLTNHRVRLGGSKKTAKKHGLVNLLPLFFQKCSAADIQIVNGVK